MNERSSEIMEYAVIKKKIKDLREEQPELNFPGFDIVTFVKKLGFVVGNIELDNNDGGFILVNPDRKIDGFSTKVVIGVNRSLSPEKKRFIIAHELGHYYLHAQEGKIMYAHRDKLNKNKETEKDADYFAANLLMPEDIFKSSFEIYKKSGCSKEELIQSLAVHFKVDIKAIEKRIGELRLIYG